MGVPSLPRARRAVHLRRGGRPWVEHVPEEPTAWPRSLIPKPNATVSPPERAEFLDLAVWLPFHGFETEDLKGRCVAHVESRTPFSAHPTTWPRLLIPKGMRCGRPAGCEAPSVCQIARWPEALQVSPETAKVFAIWICQGNLGDERRLATRWPIRPAVGLHPACQGRPTGRAIPKEGVCGPPGIRLEDPATQPTLFMSKAELFVPSQHAQVGDGIAAGVWHALAARLWDKPHGHREKS